MYPEVDKFSTAFICAYGMLHIRILLQYLKELYNSRILGCNLWLFLL